MDRATSYRKGKQEIENWIYSNFSPDSSILDVGAGCGTYYNMLHFTYPNIDAVEVYYPNIVDYNLAGKYKNVFNKNIVGFEYEHYDLIIFGDILEHLSVDDAQRVLDYALGKCKNLIVAVPFELQQDANENVYERHVQDDLTPEIVEERYPMLKALFIDNKYGIYIKK